MLTLVTQLPREKPRHVAWSPAGDRFVIAGATTLAIYTRDGELLRERALEPDGRLDPVVFGLAWSPDGAHIATAEYGPLRLRRADDLSVIATAEHRGIGRIAFCEGGRALVAGPNTTLHVLEVPTLADRGSLRLEIGGPYESFDIDHLVADAGGTFVAAADYGGYSDDEWGHTAERGVPKLTLLDSTKPSVEVRQLMQRQPITELALDPWRRRVLVGNYRLVVVRDLAGEQVTEWTPYDKPDVNAIAVCERYVVTMPDLAWGAEPTVDLWDPVSYARLGGVRVMEGIEREVLRQPLGWAAEPSPDGSRIVVVEHGGASIWAV